MHSILEEILDVKRREIEAQKRRGLPDISSVGGHNGIRDFKAAISSRERVGLVAEIKFSSPSAGRIRPISDPAEIARMYEEMGAAAISILTDKTFFNGDIRYLSQVKAAVSLPVLRKDFIIDPFQIEESYIYNADAVLLIARLLSTERLSLLLSACRDCGISALTEIHDRNDFDKAIQCGADVIGINNRNLDTFEVNLDTTRELAVSIPEDVVLISESGFRGREDIEAMKDMGIHSVLVGSAIMESADPASKTRELVEAGKC
ncbi:MAG: indole-3-glycerol phosphate synthase TrpC [Deltaproteobacteria bacterium]|nr:indole-3-glycerol phosphate synthase TrpC [Deltaproteobacteria bacterium]